MTNRVALWLFVLILIGVGLDGLIVNFAGTQAITRQLIALINWIAVWR